MAVVIAVVNQKGGVAKTTSAIALSTALASMGKRVLLADLDSQAQAGKALGVPRDDGPGVADVIWGGRHPEEVIRPEPRCSRIDVIGGSKAMANYDISLAGEPGRFDVISDLLRPVRATYDIVLLDLPPGLGLVHLGAYAAADWVLTPVTPEADAVEGLVDLMESVERAQRELDAPARLLGVLITVADLRTREHIDNIHELREALGPLVMNTIIRETTRVREASRERLSVLEYAPECTASRDYAAAAAEVLGRVEGGN